MKLLRYRWILLHRRFSSQPAPANSINSSTITINNKTYERDEYTNITPRILSLVGKNFLNKEFHPLCLVKQNIVKYFYSRFVGKTGNPIFSVYDNINPVVSVKENFDTLLVPEDHVSRQKTDCYYLNKEYILRAHTTAHQAEFLQMGLDNFLVFGDVYRRDAIDKTHYPVFHQADGVYTVNKAQIENALNAEIDIFTKNSEDTDEKQKYHTMEATKFVEKHLKDTLLGLVEHLYKKGTKGKWAPSEMPEIRWVQSTFPFTHPSWELEININDEWIETLGCGIIKQDILTNAGAGDRIGWAFGLGLERLAMQKYKIPDIRCFWSEDSGFTSQFQGLTPEQNIVYREVSDNPPCNFDISFWIPNDQPFNSNDFYDLVRNVGGDLVEQVKLTNEFFHPKKERTSHTYRIVYRHMDRPLEKKDVNLIHTKIASWAERMLHVEMRH